VSATLKSLRQRVWPAEQRDLGESLRDVHGFCEQLTQCGKVPLTNVVWSEPFSFALDRRPDIVLLADVRQAGTLQSIDTGAIDWNIEVTPTAAAKYRVKINRAATLQPGKSYDLKFLVVF
jgi:hypothetical protein